MSEEELTQEHILELFYSAKGNLDAINAAIDAKLAKNRERSITLFEKYIKSRLTMNPKVLKMADFNMTPIEAAYLSQYPGLKDVEILDLRKNGFGDAGLGAIAQSPVLTKVREMDLRNNRITRLGILALRECENWSHLEKLDLRVNQLGRQWEEKLIGLKNFPKLGEVRVG